MCDGMDAFPPFSTCVIDLSHNQLKGRIPSLLFGEYIYLGSNSLTGPPPQLSSSAIEVDLSNNLLKGSLSPLICRRIDGENSLVILDLSGNLLSGELPDCWENWKGLALLNLGDNEFTGPVPTSMAWLAVKRIRNEYNYTLGLLTGIDLSSNKLSGEIPEEVTALHSLIFLNLSENHLEGKIPIEIGSMKSLESLDLSMNKLSGVIPQSISSISFLGYLNLSFNNLSGKIPSGTQIQGFSPLSFIGNHELYGPPLTNTRSEEVIAEGTQDQTDEDDSGWIDIKWFYASMPLGFAVGFWAVLGPLAVNRAWNYAYFKFMDDMIINKFLGWCL
eukprot:XP_019081500.1 PREDICTED: leucine-rich repeat receptor protein kinase EMS1-like [Vitis vinifera]